MQASRSSWFARHGECAIFWVLALAHVVPVWAFAYVPTQDGPAHVNNAQILKNWGNPATPYEEFFELRMEPLPNLTSHLVLAALLYVLPPLVAEKALVTLYMLGFAGSFRYFLGAFGPRCVPISWVGLLLVYQRCFWLGFYNYCLGLIVLWLIIGYCLRWRGRLHGSQPFLLMLLFTAAFFTHLVIFLLGVAGAFAATILTSPRRVLAPVVVLIAALPAACLTMHYFEVTGFFRARAAQSLIRLHGQSVGRNLAAIDNELYAHHVGSEVPGTVVLAFHLSLLAAFTLADVRTRADDKDSAGWLFPAVFGLALFVMYFLTANAVAEHGGFVKTRLAPLYFLVWLALLRESTHVEVRVFLRVLTVLLVALNLIHVCATFAAGNREIAEYTAGIDVVGTGQKVFVLQPDPRPIPLVRPAGHAADYYCLGTNNINLDNYEAGTLHFPVKYRAGVRRGRNLWGTYSHKEAVDVIVCWHSTGAPAPRAPAGWDEVFHEGRLRIYRPAGKR